MAIILSVSILSAWAGTLYLLLSSCSKTPTTTNYKPQATHFMRG